MKYLIRGVVATIFLLEINFFSLFPFPDFIYQLNGYRHKLILLVITVFLYLLYVLFKQKTKTKFVLNFSKSIYYFIGVVFLIIILTCLMYSQPILNTIEGSYFYCILLLYFFFSSYFSDDNCFQETLKMFVLFSTLYCLIIFVQVIMLNKYSFVFLNFNARGLGILEYRSYGIRIARPNDFVCFSLMICALKYYERKRVNISLTISIAIQFIYVIFISMTRVYLLISIVLFLIAFILKANNKSKNRFYFIVLPMITVSVIFYGKKFINMLFFNNAARLSSLDIRVSEYIYYSKQIFLNYIFGRGFSSDDLFYQLNHGPLGNYYISDVGIIGFLSVFGILGMYFLFLLFFKIYSLIRKNKKSRSFIIMLCSYIVMMLPTLSLLDIQRIIYLPIVLAMIDYFDRKGYEEEVLLDE